MPATKHRISQKITRIKKEISELRDDLWLFMKAGDTNALDADVALQGALNNLTIAHRKLEGGGVCAKATPVIDQSHV